MFSRLEKTSKRKLLLQVENGEKMAFYNFIVLSATLPETNERFWAGPGIKLVSSRCHACLEIVQTLIQSNRHRFR